MCRASSYGAVTPGVDEQCVGRVDGLDDYDEFPRPVPLPGAEPLPGKGCEFWRDPAVGGHNADALGQGHTRRGEHLVGPQQDGLGRSSGPAPGDLEVNRQLELRGPLHGEVARPGTMQDLVNEDGCPAPQGSPLHP